MSACTIPNWQPEDAVSVEDCSTAYAVDTDPSATKDPDDRVAAIYMQHTCGKPQVVSATRGNVSAPRAFVNALEIWPRDLVVRAADSCDSELVKRYQKELWGQRLTILSIGSVRNIATLLSCQPRLSERINEVVVVAGRTRGEEFWLNPRWRLFRPLRDLNFETDRDAMVTLLQSGVRVTFIPFASGSSIRVHPFELRFLPQAERVRVRNWSLTLLPVGGEGALPLFDVVAAAYVHDPRAFTCVAVRAQVGERLVLQTVDRSHRGLFRLRAG
jgi:inosine-uridine nucleoside N-ribohydrolase